MEEYSRTLALEPRHFKALFNRGFSFDKVGAAGGDARPGLLRASGRGAGGRIHADNGAGCARMRCVTDCARPSCRPRSLASTRRRSQTTRRRSRCARQTALRCTTAASQRTAWATMQVRACVCVCVHVCSFAWWHGCAHAWVCDCEEVGCASLHRCRGACCTCWRPASGCRAWSSASAERSSGRAGTGAPAGPPLTTPHPWRDSRGRCGG